MLTPDLVEQFEKLGPKVVREGLNKYAPGVQVEAITWLAQKDREEREAEAASAAEQIALARSTRDAAREANDIAREANSIARAASASAARSVKAARTSNMIAAGALATAIVAIAISVHDMWYKSSEEVSHAGQTKIVTKTH
jgi:hypothetical protein